MKRCVIFGGGEITQDSYVKKHLRPDDLIICADSGYAHALRLGLRPDALAGDFDSWQGARPDGCRIVQASPHKDETDTILAVRLGLEQGCREFLLFGMTGGRLDHTLANLQTLRMLEEMGAKAAILDAREELYVLCGGSLILPARQGYGLSVFSLDKESHGVTLENVEYPLWEATLQGNFPLGVSNAFLTGDVRVSVKDGCLAVLVCKL